MGFIKLLPESMFRKGRKIWNTFNARFVLSINKLYYHQYSTNIASVSLQFQMNNILTPKRSQSQVTVLSNHTPVRYAGHAKWQNIKHIKEANDAIKQTFRKKLAYSIKVALRDGGGITDPKLNKKLADVIEFAKSNQVPLENINRLLNDSKDKDKIIKSFHYSIKGPSQSIFIIEIDTDSSNRTKQEIHSILKKQKFTLGDIGPVLYQFKHAGIILCSEYQGKPISDQDLDEAFANAIEAGAEDVKIREDNEYDTVLEFNTDPAPNNFYPAAAALGKLYKVVYRELEFVPLNPVTVSPEHLDIIRPICQKLISHPDVVKLFDNIAHEN